MNLGSDFSDLLTNDPTLAYYGGGWITALGILASAGFFNKTGYGAWQRKDLQSGLDADLGRA